MSGKLYGHTSTPKAEKLRRRVTVSVLSVSISTINLLLAVLVADEVKHATTILETAFAHRPVLTTRENSIIAEAAGITHQQVGLYSFSHTMHTNIQQVRTWVRNLSHPHPHHPPRHRCLFLSVFCG